MDKYKSEIREIFELVLLFNIRINLRSIFPTRALRDLQDESAFEEFLIAAVAKCKLIELPLTDADNPRFSFENLFAFASYVGEKHPEKHNVEIISKSIPDVVLMEFHSHSWLREGVGKRLDLNSDLAKTILQEFQ